MDPALSSEAASSSMPVPDYRNVSFWLDSLAASGVDDLTPRAALAADVSVDVCIVGGGLTGLWTAYYLKKANPSLDIAVLEKNIAGFGASGRNGGWCSTLFPLSASALEARYGFEAAVAMRRAMNDTVDEVGRATAAEGIDCDFVKGGTVTFVRTRAQLAGARNEVAEALLFDVDRVSLWGADTVGAKFPGAAARAATFTPDCASVQPAKLVRGLARVVESLGVAISEQTAVTGWTAGEVRVVTAGGPHTVRATTVVNATEGYGSMLPQVGRAVIPLYSLMIATEPLSEETWQRIGLEHGQTFSDFRHLLVYGQRTADNRFAFGGRGARYHWGSAIRPSYDRVARVTHHLHKALLGLFPDVGSARITHEWGGPLGVTRDWHASVGYDKASGMAWAGGYVGDGLSTTNLAGRTLADLIMDRETELTRLPWVNHRSPRWEPEPLRFLGANGGLLGMEFADVEEQVTRRSSLTARLIAPLVGR
jgi:glycine/D-amino acid oxidase-like deaminating enzyme